MDEVHEQNTYDQILDVIGKSYFYHNVTPSKDFET